MGVPIGIPSDLHSGLLVSLDRRMVLMAGIVVGGMDLPVAVLAVDQDLVLPVVVHGYRLQQLLLPEPLLLGLLLVDQSLILEVPVVIPLGELLTSSGLRIDILKPL